MINKIVFNLEKKELFKKYYYYKMQKSKENFKKLKKIKKEFFEVSEDTIIVASKEKLNLLKLSFKEFSELCFDSLFNIYLKSLNQENAFCGYSDGYYTHFSKNIYLKFFSLKGALNIVAKKIKKKKSARYAARDSLYVCENGEYSFVPNNKQVKYLGFYDKDYSKTKQFHLMRFIEKSGVWFEEIEFKKFVFSKKEGLEDKFKDLEIKVVNYTKNRGYEKELIEMIEKTGAKIVKNSNLILTITLPKENYSKNDPYKKKGFLSQNVTIKTPINKTSVSVLLKELLIKEEIEKKRFLIPKHLFGGFEFYIPYKEKLYGMKVYKDKFEFIIKDDYYDALMVIKYKDNVNVIKTTPYRKLPKRLKEIDSLLQKGIKIRNKSYSYLYDDLIGINYFEEENRLLYFTGLLPNSLRSTYKGLVIREIDVIKGRVLKEVLESMDEFFVNFKELTVMPYFAKYIREKYEIPYRAF